MLQRIFFFRQMELIKKERSSKENYWSGFFLWKIGYFNSFETEKWLLELQDVKIFKFITIDICTYEMVLRGLCLRFSNCRKY